MNILRTLCMCTPKEIYQSRGKQHSPLKVRNSQDPELKSNQSEVCRGFTPALFSQMFLCNCYSCGPPATFRTNPTVIIQEVLFHQVGRGTWFLTAAGLDKVMGLGLKWSFSVSHCNCPWHWLSSISFPQPITKLEDRGSILDSLPDQL